MLIVALASVAIWVGLLVARDGFWLARDTDQDAVSEPHAWPEVVAVVPARDEADVVGRAIASLVAQDYPGVLRIVLVDDGSSDGTADVARAAAAALPLTVVSGSPPPAGWTGKLWAMERGIAEAGTSPRYLWFTDADIEHAPSTLRSLVARAEKDALAMNSLMAELRCESVAERAFVPAFVFFFQMLYPFARVSRPGSGLAAAAGGCMLVHRGSLASAGGLSKIKSALIDDCALGALMKQQGPIRLTLTRRCQSIRPYGGWREIFAMISRSAYAQLRYSPLVLLGTLVGMALVYVDPPVLAATGPGWVRGAGGAAWLMMAIAFQPTLRFYRRSPLWGLALPFIALFYAGATWASAWHHWRGRGGMWKGRVQAERAAGGGKAACRQSARRVDEGAACNAKLRSGASVSVRHSRLIAVCVLSSVAAAGAYAVVACSSFTPADDGTTTPDATSPDDGTTPEAGAMGSDAADAGADTGSSIAACDLDKPFGEATLVQGAINSTHNDDGFWLLDGGLTAYLSSDRLDAGPDGANDYRIFTATRPDPTAAWGSITPEPNVDDAGSGRAPVLTANGLTLYFFRGAGGPTKVWTATRASLSDPFSAPTQAGAPLNVNTATTDTLTWVSPDGAAVVFSSNRNGGDIDIYRVEQGSAGFGAPVALTELSSSAEDYAIFTDDELQAFVSSKRATTKGGLDIYYARRAKKTDTFPHPAPLDILNTSVSENAAYASADGCTLYFKRATAPFGEYKIFVAARPK